jgi:hypothetical protein
MVINALHGESASLQPLLALTEVKAHIDHENVRILDLSHGWNACTRWRNGIHLDGAVLREIEVGNEGREPAVNAVAVEENGVVGHGLSESELIKNRSSFTSIFIFLIFRSIRVGIEKDIVLLLANRHR